MPSMPMLQTFGLRGPNETVDCQWAEHTLRENEARFRAFMDNSPAVAWMKDEAGRYIYVNELMERLYNIKLDDLRGKTDFDWFSEAFARQFRDNDLAVLFAQRPAQVVETVPMP